MSIESEELSEDRGARSQKARSYPSSSIRPVIYRSPDTKVCYFYKDGDVNFAGVKVTVSSRLHPTITSLQNELTSKITDLPFGVRGIYTPRGRQRIESVAGLKNDGRYICSTFAGRARGLDVNRVSGDRTWNVAARPPSGKRALNELLRDSPGTRPSRVTPRRQAWVAESDHVLYQTRTPKKIVVVVSGDPARRQTLLLYRRTLQTFEQVLEDLSEMFEMPVRKMFTMDGRLVKSLSAIYSGPEMYMVTSGERPELWAQRSSDTPYEPLEKRRKDRGEISTKTKEKKERMSRTRGKFKVWVTTDVLPSAGTTAQVGLTVYGHKGDSGLIPLGSPDGAIFKPGNIDEFEISVGSIGDIYKIRISHDNSGEIPGWFCEEVKLKDIHTEEEFLFKCQRWLSRDEDDSEICREIPVTRDGRHIYPIVVYNMTVLTGDLWNASTNANVYMTIYGERGDTGVRQLYRAGDQEKFCMGQSDSFTMEAVSLGNLTRVIVGHDGVGPGNGWFLDQVVVKEQEKPTSYWCFPCRRWLDEAEDDGKIVRELKLIDGLSEAKYKKELFDRQKWKFQTGSRVMLYSKMSHRPLRIGPDGLVDAKEEDDDNGVFLVLHKRSIYRIFQSLAKPNLHIALDSGRLVGQTKNSPFTEFIVQPQPDRSVSLESVRFPRQFIGILKDGRPANSAGKSSEPSQHFFVYCKGAFRDRGVVILWTSFSQTLSVERELLLSATGSRTRSALFRVHKLEDPGVRMFESILFPNQFFQIRDNGQCDVKGTGDSFCEFHVSRVKQKDYITMESAAFRGLFVGMTPEGRVRSTVDTSGKSIRFYPEIVEYGIPKNLALSPLPAIPEIYPVHEKPEGDVQRELNKKLKADEEAMEVDARKASITSHYEDGEWKVWLTTAESAENADIALVVYGDHGNSGLIILGSSGSKGLFRMGNTDEFKINLHDIGTLFKLRIELLPQKSNLLPSMKVKLVKLQDMRTKEVLRFKFDRWLSREKDDHDVSRELPAVRPKQLVLPVVKYRVQTYTGSLPGSDTDASVYVNLFGERGDMGKRLLFQSDNETKFLEGQTDTFEFEAVSLGPLSKCYISHNGFGPGEGWYCQQVVVTELGAETKYVFPCDMWLDSSIDDGKTERILRVKEQETANVEKQERVGKVPLATAIKDKPVKSKPGDWLLTTVTGQQSDPQMVDTVVFYVYGEKGKAGPMVLGSGAQGGFFGRGKTDEFKVSFGGNLGSLYKVRIGLLEENDHLQSNWFLQKLKMKSLSGAREILSFDVNRWMSRTREDCAVWRELAVSGPGKRPLPLIAYRVEVYTGSIPGSETSTAIFLHIFGTRGDAGKRRLYQSQNEVKFWLGQVDVFEIQAISLDEISKVVVSHDCTEKGGGWYLEKIIIREGHARVFYFPCERWLDTGKDDGAIERVLVPQELPTPSLVHEEPLRPKSREHSLSPLSSVSPSQPDVWKVYTKTGIYEPEQDDEEEDEEDDEDGNTNNNANNVEELKRRKDIERRRKERRKKFRIPPRPPTGQLIMVVYGNRGKTGELSLNPVNPDAEDMFIPGHEDEFKVRFSEDLGDIYKMRIGFADDTEEEQNWLLDCLTLEEAETGRTYNFELRSRLIKDEEFDGWCEIPVAPANRDDVDRKDAVPEPCPLPVLNYTVEVCTGSMLNASTEATVYVMLVGERGDTGKRLLLKPLSTDEKPFQPGQVDVFEILAVDLLDVQKLIVGHNGKAEGQGWFLEKVVIRVTRNDGEHSYEFPCNRWLETSLEDGLIERELLASDKEHRSERELSPLDKLYEPEREPSCLDKEDFWTVFVTTGVTEKRDAAKQEEEEEMEDEAYRPSVGQLIIVVYGDQGKTEELPLDPVNPNAVDMSIPRHQDQFKIDFSDESLGAIYKVRIGTSDGRIAEKNWFPKTLVLQCEKAGKLYEFELRDRLTAGKTFDGWWEIPITEVGEGSELDGVTLDVYTYEVELYTASRNSSELSDFHVSLFGERGDTGKRKFLKPLTSGLVEFPTPELLAEKQQAFREENHLKRHLQGSAETFPPPPFPPSTKKSEIFSAADYDEIDRHAKAAPLDLAAQSYDALVLYLVKPAKDDVGRVRALYVWVTSQHLQRTLDFIGQEVPPSGTPLLTLLLILSQHWYNGYSELFSEMCRYAGIPCEVIEGKVKGASHWIGKQHKGKNNYCTVYVAGAWRFVDPHWGSLLSTSRFNEPDSDSTYSESMSRIGSRDEVARTLNGKDSGRTCAEFYFLTDPEVLIFTHMTVEPALQLLARPVTEDEFWEMALLKEGFFDLEMTSVSHPKGVLEADDQGKIVLEFGLLKRRHCQFSYVLSKSTFDLTLNSIDGASLDQFVMMENLGEKLMVTIHFPAIGRYRFELFGKDIKTGTVLATVCEYAIYCKNPDFGFVPNPVNPRCEWGPGAEMRKLGLKPVERKGGLVTATDGECKIRFRMMKSKDVQLHGILRTTEDVLKKCICHYKTSHEAVFHLKLPHSGTFLFQIFTQETENSATSQNICNYIVKSEQSFCDLESYLPVDNEFILVGDQTTEESEIRIKAVSHEEPIIGPLSQASLDITVSSSNKTAKFRMVLERHAHRNSITENLSEYMHFRRSMDLLQISLNFPKFGFYKLSIFTGDELLYVYLVDVRNSDATVLPFPITSANWSSDFAVLKPRTGHLDAGTQYLFRVKIPGSQAVHIEVGDIRKDLARAGTSADVWEINLKTPRQGGFLNVFSKDQLLLTYTVLSTNQALTAKRLRDKTHKEEFEQLNNMVELKRKESENWKSMADVKIRIVEEDFRVNRKKYETQEALLEWREEEEMERFLPEEKRSLPIQKWKKFSSSVLGMARKLSVFHLVAVDLLDIRKLVVGHELAGIGEGCYLEKAVVRVWSQSGLKAFTFRCNRWLEKGLDDGRTERELTEESLLSEEDCWWKVFVKTGVPAKDGGEMEEEPEDSHHDRKVRKKSRRKKTRRIETPGRPSGNLHVVIYGDLGRTKVLPLTLIKPDDPKAFTQGHIDEFRVKIDEDLGDVYKVRVGFDSSDTDDENWLLDTVILRDSRSNRTYTFDFHDRLLKNEEFDGWLEAPVRPTQPWNCFTETAFIEQMYLPTLPVYVYHVEVYTGTLEGAGTDADLSVLLIGEQGDSGRHRLLKSISANPVKFCQGQMDVFEIKAVDLLDIHKVVIGHEGGSGSGHDWFLDKVIVKAYTSGGVRIYNFPCDSWLFASVEKEGAEVVLWRNDLKTKKIEEQKPKKEDEEVKNDEKNKEGEEEEKDKKDKEENEADEEEEERKKEEETKEEEKQEEDQNKEEEEEEEDKEEENKGYEEKEEEEQNEEKQEEEREEEKKKGEKEEKEDPNEQVEEEEKKEDKEKENKRDEKEED